MKILLCGYYGYGNAGDELLLSGTLRILRRTYPNAEVCVLSHDPEATATAHAVSSAINRYNPFALFRNIIISDRVIIGGGGLLQDFTGPLTLHYYLVIALCSMLFGTPTFFNAVGANRLHSFNAFLTGFVLRRCTQISVRDKETAALLRKWGVPSRKVVVTADPVFALAQPLARPPMPVTVLLVARRASDTGLYRAAIPLIVQQLEGKVVTLPFQPQYDAEVNTAIARETPEHVTAQSWLNIDDVVKQFDACHLVIAERFHALVLAAMRGLPAVCVSDDEKLIRFSRSVGYPVLRPSSRPDAAALTAVVVELWKYRERLQPFLLHRAASQNVLASRNPVLS